MLFHLSKIALMVLKNQKNSIMTLRKKISETMESQGLTPYRLCKQLEINQATFSRYIHGGTIPGEQLERVLTHLNLIKW